MRGVMTEKRLCYTIDYAFCLYMVFALDMDCAGGRSEQAMAEDEPWPGSALYNIRGRCIFCLFALGYCPNHSAFRGGQCIERAFLGAAIRPHTINSFKIILYHQACQSCYHIK